MRKRAPRRIRRTAEEARDAILDAAQRRLAEVGFSGIRLQDVAREVGVSHSTVLHHFGSREGLIQAVATRSVHQLEADLVREIATNPVDVASMTALLDSVARVLGPGGHARVVAWLSLEGGESFAPTAFHRIAKAAHDVRCARAAECGDDAPDYDDTFAAVLLAGLALFGDAIAGAMFRGESDPAVTDESRARFRAWLATLLKEHLG